jgi:cephalosporin-C deacetylase
MIHKPGIRGEGNKVFFDGGQAWKSKNSKDSLNPRISTPSGQSNAKDSHKSRSNRNLHRCLRTTRKSRSFAVSIPCPGPNNRPTTGFLTIPVDAKPKSLPAHAHFHGYGTHIQRAPRNGATNAIHFNVNAHGYDLNKEDQYYKDFFESIRSNGHGYAFDPKQNENPENAYFNGMALRLMRAFEFLKSLPEWDGKTLSSHGGSQGGLQSVWAGALEPQLTQTNPGIPWCADLGGKTVGRLAGGWNIPYVKGVDYYDCVNMAKRIPATCFVNITRAGLGDYCCPPSGVAMIYNNVKGPKRIFWVQVQPTAMSRQAQTKPTSSPIRTQK